jgi:hypothetical protein
LIDFECNWIFFDSHAFQKNLKFVPQFNKIIPDLIEL